MQLAINALHYSPSVRATCVIQNDLSEDSSIRLSLSPLSPEKRQERNLGPLALALSLSLSRPPPHVDEIRR